jgi:flagellin-like protein
MNKRGVSPLVATILLILMSIGMGVAVMSWGEEYIEEKAEFVQGVQETVTTCDVVSFSPVILRGVQQFCQDTGGINGLIDNGPDADIADFHARVLGDKGIFVQESVLAQALPRGSAAPVTFAVSDIGAVQQVKLTPKILSGGKETVCARQALLIENVQAC